MNDITKLPKWAQTEIERLQADLDYYREKLRQVGDGDTEVWVRSHAIGEHEPLPRGTHIIFKLPNGGTEVSAVGETLELYGRSGGSLAVLPRSSNVAWVRVV